MKFVKSSRRLRSSLKILVIPCHRLKARSFIWFGPWSLNLSKAIKTRSLESLTPRGAIRHKDSCTDSNSSFPLALRSRCNSTDCTQIWRISMQLKSFQTCRLRERSPCTKVIQSQASPPLTCFNTWSHLRWTSSEIQPSSSSKTATHSLKLLLRVSSSVFLWESPHFALSLWRSSARSFSVSVITPAN